MAMEHRAFIFDFESFTEELSRILETALETGEVDALIDFIQVNLDSLKDPYEGEPLDSSWQTMMEYKDAHQYGDFALTKFYDPQSNIGLGYEWEAIQNLLNSQLNGGGNMVLGRAFGPTNNYFDPGKIGSYFQTPDQVEDNLQKLNELVKQKPQMSSQLSQLMKMLNTAAKAGKGLYITF
jgi:hypothetical protein